MRQITRTSYPTKYAFQKVALLTRIVLGGCILFVVALVPCATPSFGLHVVTESEAPVDQDESSQEVALSVQTRTRVVRNQLGLPLPVPLRGNLCLATANVTSQPNPGHRLSNNFLAPLRC